MLEGDFLRSKKEEKVNCSFKKGKKKILKRNGKILAIESSIYYNKNINYFRKKLSLNPIKPPWHNCFLNDQKLFKIKFTNVKLQKIEELFSTYYFLHIF